MQCRRRLICSSASGGTYMIFVRYGNRSCRAVCECRSDTAVITAGGIIIAPQKCRSFQTKITFCIPGCKYGITP